MHHIRSIPVGSREVTEAERHFCQANGYHMPIVVNDKLCALHQFFTTVGIVVAITESSYERRYCFSEYQDAQIALFEWTAAPDNEHPGMEWIKVKGRFDNGDVANHQPNELQEKGKLPVGFRKLDVGVRKGRLNVVGSGTRNP